MLLTESRLAACVIAAVRRRGSLDGRDVDAGTVRIRDGAGRLCQSPNLLSHTYTLPLHSLSDARELFLSLQTLADFSQNVSVKPEGFLPCTKAVALLLTEDGSYVPEKVNCTGTQPTLAR